MDFSAHVYCGQTAGCTRIPLDTDVGLDPGDIVFDGNPTHPTERGTAEPPTFRPTLIWHGRRSQQICRTLVTLDMIRCGSSVTDFCLVATYSWLLYLANKVETLLQTVEKYVAGKAYRLYTTLLTSNNEHLLR